MADIVYRSFTGEVPRLEPHLLPDAAAQLALNCQFESGALTPTLGGTELATLQSNPIKGLHSVDGVNFFSWPEEVIALESPIIEDAYNRMYFLKLSEGIIRVGLTAEMSPTGPTPSTTFQAGVPQPTAAPVLTLIDRSGLPEYPGALLSAEAWWESNGVQYDRAPVILTAVTAFKTYTFPPPTQGGGTPADAVLGGKIVIKDADNVILVSTTMRAGNTSRSNGLPGGVEIGLSYSGALGTFTMLWGVTETRAYTYTNENTWGEQGAPAPAASISPTYLQDVQIVVEASDFTSYRPFSKFRFFRTYGANASYIETDVTGSGLTYLDASRVPSTVGGVLETLDAYVPPTGLSGLCVSSNGWFAAFRGNDLHMSEPYQPHAWPYVQKFPNTIRGIHPVQQGIVVTTAKGVYLLQGATPIGTGQFHISLPQPGLSQKSMVEIDGSVAYASSDGFALVAGSDATMLASQKLFTRRVWRERYGDILLDHSLRFAYHDGTLIATSSTQSKGFALRLDEDIGSYTRLNQRMELTMPLAVNDALYYTVTNKLYEFRSGAAQTFDWWGKTFLYKTPVSFGVGFLRADGNVTLTLYANEAQVYQATITPGYFTLPDMNPALRWSVRLAAAVKIDEFCLSRTFEDLKNA